MIFEDIDYDIKYDFSLINPNFFQNNLRLINLHGFQSEFDREGIELFFLSSISDYSLMGISRLQTMLVFVSLIFLLFKPTFL